MYMTDGGIIFFVAACYTVTSLIKANVVKCK